MNNKPNPESHDSNSKIGRIFLREIEVWKLILISSENGTHSRKKAFKPPCSSMKKE